MERRLAAIFTADMVGFSRLIEADETGTLNRQKQHRAELIDPTIEKHGGRIVKLTGDGMIAEFQSVVQAVQCAVSIQRDMRVREQDVSDARKIRFRIAVNLGDIILDDDDIYGDGVNIAARLEALADPGGIIVSGTAYDHLKSNVEVTYEDMGEQQLKNISRPCRAYRVVMDAAQASPAALPIDAATATKPSIAVLPFQNMSGDPEQEFFADGLTEDILTELSRYHDLFVISRNSTFVYKGQAVNIRDVAQKLGARYVVEGSVRKAGNRVRVTVQLIDTISDAHIWAERYDRNLDDIFEIQDEITSAIVSTLPGRIEQVEHELLTRKKPSNLAAYECVLAAKVLHHRSTSEANLQAMDLINRAIALEPDYAHAHAWRGCLLGQAWGYSWTDDREATIEDAGVSIRHAAKLDDNDADVQRLLAAINIVVKDIPQALRHQERAVALNPNYDLAVVQMGEVLTWMGQPEDGVEWITKAMRLNPHHPPRFWSHLGRAYFTARRYENAIDAFKHLSTLETLHHVFLAASHANLGEEKLSKSHVAQINRADPGFDAEAFLKTMHYVQPSDLAHLRDGLEKAGLIKA
jgi:adenylate cyclase